MQIIGQIFGIVAMAVSIISFQMKTQKTIVTMQLFSSLLFASQFAFLGAYTGMILNTISVFRSAVFSQRNTNKWAASSIWVVLFCVIIALTYPMAFLVFKKETSVFNFVIELFPVFGMIASTFSFHSEKAKTVRALFLISSPLWLVYNIVNGAVGGMITEIFCLISIIIAIIRLDLKKSDSNTEKQNSVYVTEVKND